MPEDLRRKSSAYDPANMAGRPPKTVAPPFGQRLAAARKRRGLSQEELADLLGTTRVMVGYYERRAKNPTLEFIERAADVLKVSVGELAGRAERPAKRQPGKTAKIERQFAEIRKLPRTQQKFLSKLLDGVLQRTGS